MLYRCRSETTAPVESSAFKSLVLTTTERSGFYRLSWEVPVPGSRTFVECEVHFKLLETFIYNATGLHPPAGPDEPDIHGPFTSFGSVTSVRCAVCARQIPYLTCALARYHTIHFLHDLLLPGSDHCDDKSPSTAVPKVQHQS